MTKREAKRYSDIHIYIEREVNREIEILQSKAEN